MKLKESLLPCEFLLLLEMRRPRSNASHLIQNSDRLVTDLLQKLQRTCFAGFGGFLYGFDTGNIGGIKAMEYWLNVFGTANPLFPGTPGAAPFLLSSSTDALVTSILSAGTFVGALAAYPAGDFLGRRHGIIAFLFLFSIGVALQTGGKTIATVRDDSFHIASHRHLIFIFTTSVRCWTCFRRIGRRRNFLFGTHVPSGVCPQERKLFS